MSPRIHPHGHPAVVSAALWVGAVWLPLAAYRWMAMREVGGGLSRTDLRGILSDLGVGLLVASGLWALSRRLQLLTLCLLALWVVAGYGNFEHVLANGANAGLVYASYLSDATFLFGSALSIGHPVLLGIASAGALALGIAAGAAWKTLGPRSSRGATRDPGTAWKLALLGALVLSLTALIQPEPGAAPWRHANAVQQNLRWAVAAPVTGGSRLAGEAAVDPRADLSGELRFEPRSPRPNVLLVVLEGISGAHIPAITEPNGMQSPIRLSELDRLARHNLVWTSFIAQQRQTNRGLYAMLCGEYPKLWTSEAKMTQRVLRGEGRLCLPEALRWLGYETVYLQAAPLAFMLKDRFMPQIGFDESHGEEWFERAYLRSVWGIDDRAFFEQALAMVERLRGDAEPWFLTLLTVGTHHPYIVPQSEAPRAGEIPLARAAEVADRSVGSFVSELAERGYLDDTLVLITSDESAGFTGGGTTFMESLSANWGFLIALLPGTEQGSIAEPFMQLDLPLSILDWLGADGLARSFEGRSVFRRYEAPRLLGFGNTSYRRVGAVGEDRMLYLCSEDFADCSRLATAPYGPFAHGHRIDRTAQAEDFDFLRALAERSERAGIRRTPLHVLREPEHIELSADRFGPQIIFAGQYFTLPANTRLDVWLELDVIGEGGSVELFHKLMNREADYVDRVVSDVVPGSSIRLHYAFTTPRRIEELESRLVAMRTGEAGLALNLRDARMQMVEDERARTLEDVELVVRSFEVQRPKR